MKKAQEAPETRSYPWDVTRNPPGYLAQPLTLALLGAGVANAPDIVRYALNSRKGSQEERDRRIKRRAIGGALLGALAGVPVGMHARKTWHAKYGGLGVKLAQLLDQKKDNAVNKSTVVNTKPRNRNAVQPPTPAKALDSNTYDPSGRPWSDYSVAERQAYTNSKRPVSDGSDRVFKPRDLAQIGQSIANTEKGYNTYFRNPFLTSMALAPLGAGSAGSSLLRTGGTLLRGATATALPGQYREAWGNIRDYNTLRRTAGKPFRHTLGYGAGRAFWPTVNTAFVGSQAVPSLLRPFPALVNKIKALRAARYAKDTAKPGLQVGKYIGKQPVRRAVKNTGSLLAEVAGEAAIANAASRPVQEMPVTAVKHHLNRGRGEGGQGITEIGDLAAQQILGNMAGAVDPETGRLDPGLEHLIALYRRGYRTEKDIEDYLAKREADRQRQQQYLADNAQQFYYRQR